MLGDRRPSEFAPPFDFTVLPRALHVGAPAQAATRELDGEHRFAILASEARIEVLPRLHLHEPAGAVGVHREEVSSPADVPPGRDDKPSGFEFLGDVTLGGVPFGGGVGHALDSTNQEDGKKDQDADDGHPETLIPAPETSAGT